MPNTTNLSGDSTSLGIGTDRNIQSNLGRQIQAAVSRANLEARIKDNESVKNLYNDVQKMVSRWSMEDKLNIIREYGNANNLPKGANESKVNDETTLTLISNLDKSELKIIVATEEGKGRGLVDAVHAAGAKAAMNAKKRTINRKNFEGLTSNPAAKMASNDKQLSKFAKNNIGGTIVPKGISRKYPTLRKELENILSGYTNFELGQTALRIGNDFPEGMAPKELRSQIINKCIMYVILIIGTSKEGVMIGNLGDGEIKEIEGLLEMTSFSWVAGKAGLSEASIVAKRKAAMNAKRKMEATKKIADNGWIKYNKIFKEGQLKVKSNGQLKTKHGFLNISGKKINEYVSRLKQSKVLDGMSEDQIKALALKKGLPADEFDPDTLKNQLYQVIATEQLAIDKQNKAQDKINEKYATAKARHAGSKKTRKLFKQMKETQTATDSMAAASTLGTADSMITSNPFAQGGDTSDKVPVVNFNEKGNIVSSTIAQAVPVLIVGSYDTRGTIQTKQELNDTQKKMDATGLYGRTESLLEKSEKGKHGETRAQMAADFGYEKESHDLTAGINGKKVGASLGNSTTNISMPTTTVQAAPAESGVTASISDLAMNDKTANISKKLQDNYMAARARGGKIKFTDQDSIFLNNLNEEKGNEDSLPVSRLRKYMSGFSYTLLKKSKFSKSTIMPVLDVNKTHEYAGYLETIRDYLGSIASFTSTFYTAFIGLQQGGLSVNAASATGSLAKLQQTLQGVSSLAGNIKFASGGSAKASSSVSNIVTGDSRTGKNNTELVSVNWANKKVNVTPVPKMATGGDVSSDQSGVSGVSRLTSGDRSKPLSVGIATGTVKYTKVLSGVEDDGSGTAVKVYSVNTGINEKIKVGDSEASLFDMVYGIYGTLATMAQGITTSNQLLTSISTSAASTSGYAKQLASKSGSGSSSGFEFPTNLDSILSGK